MEAVIDYERALGNVPRDVSAEKKGWDIESRDAQTSHLRFIEVKGRHADARDVIVTKNEILASLNAPDAFHLALVTVENGFATSLSIYSASSSASWSLPRPQSFLTLPIFCRYALARHRASASTAIGNVSIFETKL